MKRYQALADDLEAAIRKGVLRPGDRLPSVRTASTSRGVSASTVFQAYYLLEARGLVRARERSGYYVTEAARPVPPQPRHVSQPPSESVRPEIDDLVFSILEAPVDPEDVGLASAFPSPVHYPFRQLGRALAAGAQDFDPSTVRDGMPPGNAHLLRHIAARYHADGVPLDDGEIVVTNGALEALNLCLATLTRPGDSVIIECPAFYGALLALERRGVKAVQVPTCPTQGVDVGAVEDAIRRHKPKAAWLMTTFQNPLGCLMSADRKRELVGVLARHGVALIEDDVYQELFFGAQRPLPAKAYDEDGTVLHCSSFSKCLAPGYRVGWVAAGRHAAALRRQKLTLSTLTAVPVQVGLARYLDQGGYERHLRRLRATLQAQRDAMGEALCAAFPEGTEATRPQGGYFLWVKLPPGGDALALHARAAEHGIRFAPGPMFSATRDFRDCLRLNYGREWTPATERAIATLGQLLRQPKLRVA